LAVAALDTVPRRPTPIADLGGWPALLNQLANGRDLEEEQAASAMAEMLEGAATPAQVAAFVFGLRCKGETVDELAAMLQVMLDASQRVVVEESVAAALVDTCGTGGDRSGSINVSTIAALVVAGAGTPVCKHGGRAASSRTGSADVLEALGVNIEASPATVAACITAAGIGFCFAPRFHPAMRHVGPTRSQLGVRTAFNLLGPVANPARVPFQLVGVGDPTVAERVAGVLARTGSRRAWVVHGDDGLDELSTAAPSQVVEWDAATGRHRRFVVDPAALGLAPAHSEALRGGDVATNAAAVRAVLAGTPGPHRDIVLLNAAAALVVGGGAADLAAGLERAAQAIDSGAAAAALATLVRVSTAGD
jgi:anthranilate phosphoribosyltransferase